MKCPQCQYKFNPLKVRVISRWKSLKCPACQSRWNRRIDLQFILVSLFPIPIVLFVAYWEFRQNPNPPLIHLAALLALTALIVFPIQFLFDAATIRLVRENEEKDKAIGR